MAQKKKVAVIGAGPSGLVTIKTLLQDGHDVKCYEMSPTIGGQWNYETFKTDYGYQKVDNYDQPIQAVYKSLRMNTSKDITAFSDFPMREEDDLFLDHWEYRDYLGRYAEHFGLMEHIQLETKVTRLVKGKAGWTVFAEYKAGESLEENFDFVLIASGCFKFPSVPDFKGMNEDFKGVVLHSAQVRDEVIFNDKRVLVIGGGYSGCEVAVGAINNKVSKLYFCVTNETDKRNHWAMSRYVPGPQGHLIGWDCSISRHEYFDHPDLFDARFKSWCELIHSKDGMGEMRFPGDRLALTDTELISASLKSKQMEKVGAIDHFEANDVVLGDGTRLSNIDFVVMGTGFLQRYPFVDDIWSPKDQVTCELYRYVILPEPQMDGLGFVVTCPAPFPLFSVMEMQARWLSCKLLTRDYDRNGSLFTEAEREAMRENIKVTRKAQPDDLPYNYLVDNYGYLDKLAKEIGCNPPSYEEMETMGKEGQMLAAIIRYGPIMGNQYRLQGPGKWNEAKDTIIKIGMRVLGEEKIKEYLK